MSKVGNVFLLLVIQMSSRHLLSLAFSANHAQITQHTLGTNSALISKILTSNILY